MDLKSQKKIAAKILKCGVSRVRLTADKSVEDALTRNDIRDLIQKGLITKVQKKGTSKSYSKNRTAQKKRGRKSGFGSRAGTMKARTKNPKIHWLRKVRPLRRMIKELRDSGIINRSDYTKIYRKIKGGFFRDKKHLISYLKTNDLIKRPDKTKTKTKVKKEKTGKAEIKIKE